MESKKQQWSEEETQCFLALWSSEEVQPKLEGATRTKPVFESIQREMAAAGFERSVDQLVNKLKKLKKDFRDQKRELGRSGSGRPKRSPHYELLNAVLGERPANQDTGALNSATAYMESTLVDSLQPMVTDPDVTEEFEALRPASPTFPTLNSPSNSPCGSISSPAPSCSTPLHPCSSSASASSRTKSTKRKRDTNADVLQFLERSEERFLEQNQLDRELTTAMFQEMRETSAALIGLVGHMVSVMERRENN